MVPVIQFYPEWLEFPFSFAWGKHFIANRVWIIEVFIVFPSVAASKKVKEREEWLFESWVKAGPSGEERIMTYDAQGQVEVMVGAPHCAVFQVCSWNTGYSSKLKGVTLKRRFCGWFKLHQWFSERGPRPGAPASLGKLLEMSISGPSLGWSRRWCWCTFKFENLCYRGTMVWIKSHRFPSCILYSNI